MPTPKQEAADEIREPSEVRARVDGFREVDRAGEVQRAGGEGSRPRWASSHMRMRLKSPMLTQSETRAHGAEVGLVGDRAEHEGRAGTRPPGNIGGELCWSEFVQRLEKAARRLFRASWAAELEGNLPTRSSRVFLRGLAIAHGLLGARNAQHRVGGPFGLSGQVCSSLRCAAIAFL